MWAHLCANIFNAIPHLAPFSFSSCKFADISARNIKHILHRTFKAASKNHVGMFCFIYRVICWFHHKCMIRQTIFFLVYPDWKTTLVLFEEVCFSVMQFGSLLEKGLKSISLPLSLSHVKPEKLEVIGATKKQPLTSLVCLWRRNSRCALDPCLG